MKNKEKSMPAAIEPSQNIENPLESIIISSNFLEMFFFWKSLEFSPDLENLLRDLAGRARNLSARPKSSKSQNLENRFPALPIPSKMFLVGCMVSKSLIPDVLEFLPDLKSPQPNGYFECRGSPDSSDWLIGSHIGRIP